MDGCQRAGRLFGGCKFRPRYDTVAPGPGTLAALTPPIMTYEIEALCDTRWVADVCERCGKSVERA